MFNIIERFMNKLTIDDVNQFATKNEVFLSSEELEFTYNFVKKNWQTILANPNTLNIERYQNMYSEENFIKIKKLLREYSIKYKNYL